MLFTSLLNADELKASWRWSGRCVWCPWGWCWCVSGSCWCNGSQSHSHLINRIGMTSNGMRCFLIFPLWSCCQRISGTTIIIVRTQCKGPDSSKLRMLTIDMNMMTRHATKDINTYSFTNEIVSGVDDNISLWLNYGLLWFNKTTE